MWWILIAALFIAYLWFIDSDLNLRFWTLFGPKENDALVGKVAFITGAGSGIGKALALRWASKSVRLALNDLSLDTLEKVKKTCLDIGKSLSDKDILLLPGDVTQPDNHRIWVKAIVDHFGRLDILVNNAGRVIQGPCVSVSYEQEKALLDVNTLAPIGLAKAVLPHMLSMRTGYIVQISSVLAKLPSPTTVSYGASKAAVHAYFTSLRTELWKDNIAVTTVCPGPVQTNIITHSTVADGFKPAVAAGNYPSVLHGMSKRRCAELISTAMVNKLGEVWISTHPVLILSYVNWLAPLFVNWFGASVVVPISLRLLSKEKKKELGEQNDSMARKNK